MNITQLVHAGARGTGALQNPAPVSGALNLENILPDNCILLDLAATTYLEAVQAMIHHLCRCGYVTSYEECLFDVMSRETLASTILEGGIAMPHAKTTTARQLISAVAVCSGMEDTDKQGHPVRIIVLTVTPASEVLRYMDYIAAAALKLFRLPDLASLCACATASEFKARLLTS